MKNTYIIFLLLVLLCSRTANAQPYKSMFGLNTTSWIFKWSNMPGTVRDSAYAAKDTTVNGTQYKLIHTPYPPYEGGLMREDVTTGKVWYRNVKYILGSDTTEHLLFDFNLQQGDTFDISNAGFQPPLSVADKTVDSVRTIGNLKYIYFGAKFGSGEPYTIIEGVGSNMGVVAKQYPTPMLGQYLLCSYKDGEKTDYANKEYDGDCVLAWLGVEKLSASNEYDITVYPNPASEIISIQNSSANIITKIQVLTPEGRIQKQIEQAAIKQINVTDLPIGYYFIYLYTDNKQLPIKPLLIQR